MARTQGSRAEITGPLVRAQALRLFARHGYAAVSMRQIAAGVGVQAGALYAYTPDKQALLADLLETHMRDLLAAWQDDPAQPPLARLEGFVRFHINFSLDHPDAVFLSYMELRNLTPENHGRIAALRTRYEDGLDRILHAGTASGAMQLDDPRLARMALIAMLTGVTNWYREGGRLDRTRIADIYWGLARGAVGAD
ncbi:MAG: TetR/AcrR family transcriptional regulator [Paracoccus sp. (in: a-proteobacteria)]|jgi:AcrR family transcriptional regulator|uniref:TetR/AcrR family transcriptional regulator n=1 Tax=unclassified Paracoccus (in: a-proteobacteria) TaxID=2688777 RepID=UPI000C5FA6CA|nr:MULTISPECIES: TetR/AcrR family transcriptional regulator [unclassified Paracoccus (in: a-proteobacteria)]MAN55066.1 TetR family transcriptional regulator [Paracoccus sp. (in: a-proteobacteria)]MBA50174.1 TetR family transcriptional regulator [Paracoccus sp. (in: a-proteobacteria)]HIC65003.1 TetR/AcrR family transcriptional regulator [Paracoccus sp. (in: a-proteobacteria)]|tara:strand:+ start:129 stop:716 length:588 start_codon:yes stop_codon:yes gene_type:complete